MDFKGFKIVEQGSIHITPKSDGTHFYFAFFFFFFSLHFDPRIEYYVFIFNEIWNAFIKQNSIQLIFCLIIFINGHKFLNRRLILFGSKGIFQLSFK